MVKVSHPGRPHPEKIRSDLSQTEQPLGGPDPVERDLELTPEELKERLERYERRRAGLPERREDPRTRVDSP